jgi:DNA-binding MarR family transcriptional regulator
LLEQELEVASLSTKSSDTIVIDWNDQRQVTLEVLEYARILTNPTNWHIIRLLDIEPMDVRVLSSQLYRQQITERPLSRQAIMKHIRQLLRIGVLRRQAGLRDNRTVTQYVIVPEGIETILRSLNNLQNYDLVIRLQPTLDRVSGDFEKYLQRFPRLRLLNGPDAGRVFRLRKDMIRIGRTDPHNRDAYDPDHDIVLSSHYQAVSRVSKPHAILGLRENTWYLEHQGGVNGTFLESQPLRSNAPTPLHDRCRITLARGAKGAQLIFLQPSST